jgi:hypothetical protein
MSAIDDVNSAMQSPTARRTSWFGKTDAVTSTVTDSKRQASTRPNVTTATFVALIIAGAGVICFAADVFLPEPYELSEGSKYEAQLYSPLGSPVNRSATPPLECVGSTATNPKCCNGLPELCERKYDQVHSFCYCCAAVLRDEVMRDVVRRLCTSQVTIP